MNQKDVGTWHHHSRTMPAVLFSRKTQAPQSRSERSLGSGMSRTSPPQTNSEMLRGPFSGQLRIFMTASMSHRRRALFADLVEIDEAVEAERRDQVRHLAGG